MYILRRNQSRGLQETSLIARMHLATKKRTGISIAMSLIAVVIVLALGQGSLTVLNRSNAMTDDFASVTAKENLDVFASPPKNFLFIALDQGKKTCDISVGDRFKIFEEKMVPTLLERSLWYRVRCDEPGPHGGERAGWVYGGSTKERKTTFKFTLE